jgi:hypothetical protein
VSGESLVYLDLQSETLGGNRYPKIPGGKVLALTTSPNVKITRPNFPEHRPQTNAEPRWITETNRPQLSQSTCRVGSSDPT